MIDEPPHHSVDDVADDDPSPSPRARRVLRALQWFTQATLVLVAIGLVVFVGWLQSGDFRQRVRGLAAGVLEDALGENVAIEGVNARYWPPGVTVTGVVVSHHATGEPILSADKVRIPLRIPLTGGFELGVVHLQRPTVHVHLEEDQKLREFRERRPPPTRAAKRRLPFRGLRVDGGQLQLEHPEGFIRIDDLSITPEREGSVVSGELSVAFRDLRQSTRFAWPATRIEPEAVHVPYFSLDTPLLSVAGPVEIDLEGPILADLAAKVRLEELAPALGEPRMLRGLVDVDVRARGTLSDPTARVLASVQDLRARLPGVLTPILTYEFGDLTLSAEAGRDGMIVEQATMNVGGGRVVAWARITPELEVVGGHAVADGVHLEPLLRAFDAAPTPWVDFDADAEITFAGPLTPPDLRGRFDFALADLEVADRPIRDPDAELRLHLPHAQASGRIHLDEAHKNIRLDADVVRAPLSSGSARIDIGLLPRGPLDLRFELSEADLEDFRPLSDVALTGQGVLRGRIWGPFNRLQLAGEGTLHGFSVLGVPYADDLTAQIRSPDMQSIFLDQARARRGQTRYGGSFGFDFKPPLAMYTDIAIDRGGRLEDVLSMFVDLPGLRGEVAGTLELGGPLYALDGEADLRLADVDLYGERFPIGHGRGFMDEGRFTLDDLRVRRHEGREGITLRGSVDREWALDMELNADGLRLERLDRLRDDEVELEGQLSVAARIRNTLFDPAPEGAIWLTGVEYEGSPVPDSNLRFDTREGVAHLRGQLVGGTTDLTGTLGLWDAQPYVLHADLREVPAHVLYPTAADGAQLRGLLSGSADVSGHFGPTPSPVTLDAELSAVELRFHHHVLRNQAPWRLHVQGEEVRLRDFNLYGPSTQVAFEMESSDTLFLAGEGVVDLDLLRAVVPGVERASGRANILMEALGTQPDINAVVHVTAHADLFRHSGAPVTFEDANARLRLDRDGFEVLGFTAELGGGQVRAEGRIDAERWAAKRYNLTMQVDDAQVQWVESLPPAIGNAALAFDGPVDSLLLSGNVEITDMTFSDRIDWEDWVVSYRETMLLDPAVTYDEPPLFNLNVSLGADRTVRLQNNVAEGTATADLRVIGDTNRPGLVGTVTVLDGLAFLQDREFRIDRGNVMYNDPWSWDPLLDFSLVTDINSRDQRYRVTYQVSGPFSDWRTTTRSEPPLPQSDVNALLWFGVTLEELEERGDLSTAVVQGVADLLFADMLLTGPAGFRTELPEFLQFDRVDLATGVNVRGDYSAEPRLVVDKRLRDLADIDLTWEVNLRRPDEAYVSAEKRIGGRWSLSGWYATLQRDRVLPIGGAYGVDVSARWEIE